MVRFDPPDFMPMITYASFFISHGPSCGGLSTACRTPMHVRLQSRSKTVCGLARCVGRKRGRAAGLTARGNCQRWNDSVTARRQERAYRVRRSSPAGENVAAAASCALCLDETTSPFSFGTLIFREEKRKEKRGFVPGNRSCSENRKDIRMYECAHQPRPSLFPFPFSFPVLVSFTRLPSLPIYIYI